ncbi:hypothetical protein CKAH01_05585 [Colletotrichum kahawae]|uniref:Uncharacterized protein n=1 Tax=Colletotrichum kahawae TaxID=34407 RepID=A0AAD9YD12_COLKA|nr:hypothetical protein CKAH01_05585 [Colletotrichum kahawae]
MQYWPSLDPAVKRQTDILTQPSDTSEHDTYAPLCTAHCAHTHKPTRTVDESLTQFLLPVPMPILQCTAVGSWNSPQGTTTSPAAPHLTARTHLCNVYPPSPYLILLDLTHTYYSTRTYQPSSTLDAIHRRPPRPEDGRYGTAAPRFLDSIPVLCTDTSVHDIQPFLSSRNMLLHEIDVDKTYAYRNLRPDARPK